MNRDSGARFVQHLRWTVSCAALAHVTDKELLRRFVTDRDDLAFEALLRRHAPMVWGVCRRLLTRHQDAEDALQATFLVFVRRASSIKQGELLANWLFGVARRVARNIERQQLRFSQRVFLCGNLVDLAARHESRVNDIISLVDDELAGLPRKFRLPLLLRSLEGMTHEEAARSLGWPKGTVASRLSRGRELLRLRLARRGITVSIATLTTLWATEAGSAAVSPLVIAGIVRLVSTPVASGVRLTASALAQTVLQKMILSRLLLTACVTVGMAGTLGGAFAFWHRARAHQVARVDMPVASPANSSPVRLPTNPEAVVLQMERAFGDGQISTRVRIHADGRLVAEVPQGVLSLAAHKSRKPLEPPAVQQKNAIIEGKLSPLAFAELLQFVVTDQEFFEFRPGHVRKSLQTQPPPTGRRRYDRPDATTTRIELHTADRQYQVSWERLSDAAWKYPQMKRLAQLYAVDMRLQQEFHVALAGGIDYVEKMAELVNTRTQEAFVNAPRLTVRDLKSFVPATETTPATFSFFRSRPLADMPDFWVTMELQPESEPRFGFTYPPDGPIRVRQPGFFPCMATPYDSVLEDER